MHVLNTILQHMQEYAKYAAIAGPTVAEYGGEFLARGGDATQVPTDNVCLVLADKSKTLPVQWI